MPEGVSGYHNGTRRRILALLASVSAVRARTLAGVLGVPQNLAGIHLSQMARAGLLRRLSPPEQRYDVWYGRSA